MVSSQRRRSASIAQLAVGSLTPRGSRSNRSAITASRWRSRKDQLAAIQLTTPSETFGTALGEGKLWSLYLGNACFFSNEDGMT
jgi:hypothetical protein